MADLFSPDVLVAQPLDHALALSARYYTDPQRYITFMNCCAARIASTHE